MAMTPNSEEHPKKPAAKKKSPKTAAAKKSPASQAEDPSAGATLIAGARTGLTALVFIVLGLAVLAGAGYATAPFWLDKIKPYLPAALKDPFEDPRLVKIAEQAKDVGRLEQARALDAAAIKNLNEERARFSQQLTVLMKRLDEQDRSLKSMQKMIQATTPPSAAVDANKSISRLSNKLSRLEKNAGALDEMLRRISRLEKDEQAIANITRRLIKLEAAGPRSVDTVTEASAMVLAVNQLRDALRRPASFAKELGMVKRLAKNNPDMLKAIAVLEPLSAKGVPTIATLRSRFQQTAQDVVKASGKAAERSWTDRVMNRLKGLVTIRRVGEKGDASPEGLMARAEELLKDGDLIAAVEAFDKLTGKAAEAAQPWLKAARSRVAAERALASLHVQAVALLAPVQEK